MINRIGNDVVTYNGYWLNYGTSPVPPDPYNPLNLPPGVIRVRTSDGNPPRKSSFNKYDSATLVEGTTDVYDIYKSGTDFNALFAQATTVIECLGGNTSHVTNMGSLFTGTSIVRTAIFDTRLVTIGQAMFDYAEALTEVPAFNFASLTNAQSMFASCTSLVTVPVFNTPLLEECNGMFYGCTSLKAVPQLVTPNVTNVMTMFGNCPNVESGALSMYQYFNSFGSQITNHYRAFYWCGKDTVTGSAELAQIPDGWK